MVICTNIHLFTMEVYNKAVSMTREVVQAEALKVTMQHKRCGLGISMGVGKTRIAIEHLKKNYDPFILVLVVVPKNSVKKSWTDELTKMGDTNLLQHIRFSTYLSINKQDPGIYDIVYLDECHSLLENHELFLSNYKGKILGLTGTPPRSIRGSEKARMVQKYCPIKYTFSVDNATDSNILNDYQIVVHELELSDLKNFKEERRKMADTGIHQRRKIMHT